MNQWELLWNYQQADMEAEKLESQMKRSPARQKLLKYQEYLREQKAANLHIEEEVHAMADRIDALKDAISHMDDQLKTLKSKFEAENSQDIESIQNYIQETQKLIQNINSYEQEVRHIRKDTDDRDKQQRDIMQRATKARSEYDDLKAKYDVEYAADKQKLAELRSAAAEKTVGIDAENMSKYKTIKQHCLPPLAQLSGDQCGGCRMSLPSATLRSVKAGQPVECESCGRLLIHI